MKIVRRHIFDSVDDDHNTSRDNIFQSIHISSDDIISCYLLCKLFEHDMISTDDDRDTIGIVKLQAYRS